jgi:hypothetical protein
VCLVGRGCRDVGLDAATDLGHLAGRLASVKR